jgi:ribosomal protein S18 acetylase RimI-like enzyme
MNLESMAAISVREMKKQDIPAVSKLHQECFPSDATSAKASLRWITANYRAHPRFVYYVAEQEHKIRGYVLWMELAGFCQEAVIELEQIGIAAAMRGKGIGTVLVKKSVQHFIRKYVRPRSVQLIKVTTGTDNKAQGLYKKALGAEPECVMKNIFHGDELIMFSRKRSARSPRS